MTILSGVDWTPIINASVVLGASVVSVAGGAAIVAMRRHLKLDTTKAQSAQTQAAVAQFDSAVMTAGRIVAAGISAGCEALEGGKSTKDAIGEGVAHVYAAALESVVHLGYAPNVIQGAVTGAAFKELAASKPAAA